MSARKCTARSATTIANMPSPARSRSTETSEYLLYAGFFAAASGQEFFAWRGGVGTSIPQLNKELVEFIDPIGKTKKIIAVPPLRPDWAIIHVGWSDVYGNGQHLGARFGDRWMARAANRIMTQTERIVPNSVIRKNPFMTTIAYADVVVEAPYGGHPYAAHGFYKEDVEFIQDYVKCSEANRKGDTKTWDALPQAPHAGALRLSGDGRHQEAPEPLHPSDRQLVTAAIIIHGQNLRNVDT